MRSVLFRFLVIAVWMCSLAGAFQARCERIAAQVAAASVLVERTPRADGHAAGGRAEGACLDASGHRADSAPKLCVRKHAVPPFVEEGQEFLALALPGEGCPRVCALPGAAKSIVPDRRWFWSLPPPATPVELHCLIQV